MNRISNLNANSFGEKAISILSKQKAVFAIAIMLFIMFFFDTNFYTWLNWRNIFLAASPILIIGFGVTLAVICKGCDLSVGAVLSMAGIVAIMLINSGMNVFLAVVIAILSGSVVGAINGYLIVHQKSEAFIITLGMGMLVKGVGMYLNNANPVSAQGDAGIQFQAIAQGNLLGIPNIVAIMIGIGLFTFWLLRYTSFGRNCYALGGDYEVAEHSGINVIRTKWLAFVLCGTYAAIAGVLMSSRLNSGNVIFGDPIPLMVNCSVVIGGTSFAGGVGGVGRSFIGIMVLQILMNAMGALEVPRFHQQLVIGVVIVSIIALDCYAIKRKKEDV